jgi:hypothetical protein
MFVVSRGSVSRTWGNLAVLKNVRRVWQHGGGARVALPLLECTCSCSKSSLIGRQAAKSRSHTVWHFGMRLPCLICYTISAHYCLVLADDFCQYRLRDSHHEDAAEGDFRSLVSFLAPLANRKCTNTAPLANLLSLFPFPLEGCL